MAKILIIEDEQSIQKLLSYDLNQAGYDVEVASNGKDGYKKAKNGNFDLIVLDLMLPLMDGVEVCKKLRDEGNDVYVIMLTARDDEIDKITGLDSGADDYMTKPFSPREVIARIKAGLRRQNKKVNKEVISLKDITLDLKRHELYLNDQLVTLTHKEFELLHFLLKNKGIALSRDRLLETLWGFEYDGDTRIVDVHIFKLREKLTTSEISIKTKRGVGYMLEDE
ncbi:response regulator transcription factor [Haloplasma contractile]|uniref:Two-component response phosphate regulator protein n=1 Tax=Haloplasma contractile SSD-17B TaxID=1033810 RepID=F7PWM7_9MOLU|nr:response regulator transcription factor [Haloplasma contractile]ERJ12602.1 Two-component response phosphate regulator protein [Haloplasma contractile SSD-17B]